MKYSGFALLLACSALCFVANAEPIRLPAGQDWQVLIEQAPPDAVFIIPSGVHRERQLVPRNGQVFRGEAGAILSGAVVLSDWFQDGNGVWSHNTALEFLVVLPTPDAVYSQLAAHSQELFSEGERLSRVFSRAAVTGSSPCWYFDPVTRRVSVNVDPTGKCMEIMGSKGWAISDGGQPGHGEDVTVSGVIVEKYPTGGHTAAVRLGSGAIVEHCEFRWNHSIGLTVGDNGVVRGCWAHHNGLIGMTAFSHCLIEDCELSGNAWGEFPRAFTSGGIKVVGQGTVFRSNYSHHNFGPGAWFDIESRDVVASKNVLERNDWEGLLFEISDGLLAEHNACRFNGTARSRGGMWGAQIAVQNGSHVVVRKNFLQTNSSPGAGSNGIVCINQPRGGGPNIPLYYVHDALFADNVVCSRHAASSGLTYGSTGYPDYGSFLGAGNVWIGNRYIGGEPSRLRWHWFDEASFSSGYPYGAPNHPWGTWLTVFGQDAGGTLEGRNPDSLRDDSLEMEQLATSTVGFDVAAFKARFARAPDPADSDSDQLPDWWERQTGLSTSADDSLEDPDGDGLSNRQEYLLRTDPHHADTDADGMDDAWEVNHGLNPVRFGASDDSDGDGLTDWEEFLAATDPRTVDAVPAPLPVYALALSARASLGVSTSEAGKVTSLDIVGVDAPPRFSASGNVYSEVVDGVPRVVLDSGALGASGWESLESANGDYTLSLVIRASPGSSPDAGVVAMERYLQSGLRLSLTSDFLTLSSNQSGGSAYWPLPEGLADPAPRIVTIINRGGAAPYCQICVNGREVRREAGSFFRGGSQSLLLGVIGGYAWGSFEFYEIDVFRTGLTPPQRLALEQRLRERYRGAPVLARDDTDFDGVPDDFELANGGNPDLIDSFRLVPGGSGRTMLEQYALHASGMLQDTDGDGMPDGWENAHGLNREVADGNADADGDGVSNLEEFEDGTDPQVFDQFPEITPMERLSAVWRLEFPSGSPNVVDEWVDVRGGAWTLRSQETGGGLRRLPGGGRLRTPGGLATGPASRDLIDDSNFALQLAVRPLDAPVDQPAVIVSHQAADGAGFVFGLRNNRPRWWSTGSGTPVVLEGPEALPSNSLSVVSLVARSRQWLLYVNGTEVGRVATGGRPASLAGLKVGNSAVGTTASFELGDMILWGSAPSHLLRRGLDDALRGAHAGAGPYVTDSDGDGVPDWAELLGGTPRRVADGEEDPDHDGQTNRAAFLAGRAPIVYRDFDGDGMQDGWERSRGLNPADPADALLDPDGNGRVHLVDHALNADAAEAESKLFSVRFDPATDEFLALARRNPAAWNTRVVVEARSFQSNEWTPVASTGEVLTLTDLQQGVQRWKFPKSALAGNGLLRLRVMTLPQ